MEYKMETKTKEQWELKTEAEEFLYKNIIGRGKEVKDITIKNHLRRWRKMNNAVPYNNKEPHSYEPLDYQQLVIKWVEEQPLTSQRTYLNTLCVFYCREWNENMPKFMEKNNLYLNVKNLLQAKTEEYNKLKAKQEKTKKEIKEWEEWSKIIEKRNKQEYFFKKSAFRLNLKTKTISKKQLFDFQEYLIMCLYTYIFPKRCEYANVKTIVNYKILPQEAKDNFNFLEVVNSRKKIFWFGKNACKAKAKKNEKVIAPKGLNYVLNLWFHLSTTYNNQAYTDAHPYKAMDVSYSHFKKWEEEHDTYINGNMNWLLLNENMERMKENTLCKKVKKIFGGGVSMLRKSYVSHIRKGDTPLEVKKEMCRVMNHSLATQELYYLKHK